MAAGLLVGTGVLFGSYNSEIQTQILADIIVDGSTSYAQNNMDMYEPAMKAVMKKLFDANSEYNNGVELLGYTIDGPNSATTAPLTSEELKYLLPRAKIMQGTVKTPKWDNKLQNMFSTNNLVKGGASNMYDGNGDLKPQYAGIDSYQVTQSQIGYKYVPYEGPCYKDKTVTVSVTARCNIPFLGQLTEKTRSATSLTISSVPYNSRIPPDENNVNEVAQLEALAYEECMATEEERNPENKKLVRYNSIRQKILFEARRAFGDGYYIPADTIQWPQLPMLLSDKSQTESAFVGGYDVSKGEFGPDSINYMNKLKSCYHFVSACFKFDGLGGFSDALSKLPYKMHVRGVTFTRAISCTEIWEKMHPALETKASFRWNASDKSDGNGINFNTESGYYSYWHIVKSRHIFKYESGQVDLPEGYRFVEKRGTVGQAGGYVEYNYSPPPEMTLGEVIDTYAAMEPETQASGPRVWQVEKADGINESDLRVGDVLVWADPNWFPHMLDELTTLAAIERTSITQENVNQAAGYDVDAQFDQPSGKMECHWCIYIGNMNLVHMTGEVGISPLVGGILNPGGGWTGPVVHKIYRFFDSVDDMDDWAWENHVGDEELDTGIDNEYWGGD